MPKKPLSKRIRTMKKMHKRIEALANSEEKRLQSLRRATNLAQVDQRYRSDAPNLGGTLADLARPSRSLKARDK